MELKLDVFSQFDKKWAILCAGTRRNHNAMTISWGGVGSLWSKPVVTVYVKPIRHIYQFLESHEYFTVSFFSEEYRNALMVMGSKSGSNCDKTALAGLTPKALSKAVMFEEAEITLLCKKIYYQDMLTENMTKDVVKEHYALEKPHRMYIGEVVEIMK